MAASTRSSDMSLKGSPVANPVKGTPFTDAVGRVLEEVALGKKGLDSLSSPDVKRRTERTETLAGPVAQKASDEKFNSTVGKSLFVDIKVALLQAAHESKDRKKPLNIDFFELGSGGNATVGVIWDKGNPKEVYILNFMDLPRDGYLNLCKLRSHKNASKHAAEMYYAKSYNVPGFLDSYRMLVMMEFCRGGSLSEYSQLIYKEAMMRTLDQDPLKHATLHPDIAKPEDALFQKYAIKMTENILLAYQSLNAVGVFMRDTKPGNILMRSDGGVIFQDFKGAVDGSQRGAGTNLYDYAAGIKAEMSNEIIQNKLLGVTLYLAVTRQDITKMVGSPWVLSDQDFNHEVFNGPQGAILKNVITSLTLGLAPKIDIVLSGLKEECKEKKITGEKAPLVESELARTYVQGRRFVGGSSLDMARLLHGSSAQQVLASQAAGSGVGQPSVTSQIPKQQSPQDTIQSLSGGKPVSKDGDEKQVEKQSDGRHGYGHNN